MNCLLITYPCSSSSLVTLVTSSVPTVMDKTLVPILWRGKRSFYPFVLEPPVIGCARIHVRSTACDIFSFNGRGQLCQREEIYILRDPGAVSRAGLIGATKVFKHGRKSPWVLTLTGPFPNGQAIAGSWLGTKNALYYCAQSANSISWVLFVSSYMTAIDSITACLAHAPKKCTQSGLFQFDINATFQNTE